RVTILTAGKTVATGAPAELKADLGGEVITLVPGPDATAAEIAATLHAWSPRVSEDAVRIETTDPEALTRARAAVGGRARTITVGRPTLEDVFLHLTGHTFWDAASG